jgi:toxin ParE1/3/4
MAAHILVISPAAREDLEGIYHYGCRNWGLRRSSQYLDQIKEQLWCLTENSEIGIKRDELLLGVRSMAVASHIIFYRPQSGQVEVIRVLHVRQDHQPNLKS